MQPIRSEEDRWEAYYVRCCGSTVGERNDDVTESVPRLQIKEQAREQDERDDEDETEFPQQRHAAMSICGGYRGSFNNLIKEASVPRWGLLRRKPAPRADEGRQRAYS